MAPTAVQAIPVQIVNIHQTVNLRAVDTALVKGLIWVQFVHGLSRNKQRPDRSAVRHAGGANDWIGKRYEWHGVYVEEEVSIVQSREMYLSVTRIKTPQSSATDHRRFN